MPAINASGRFLHIPNKSWSGTDAKGTQEKQNYDEIERWALRVPRGLIALGINNNAPLTINSGDLTDRVFVNTTHFQMESGRVYKTTATWSSIVSGTQQDGLALRIRYVPDSSSNSTNVGPYLYANAGHGGQIVNYAVPRLQTESVGTYVIDMIARWWAGPSASSTIIAAQGQEGTIFVEDLGIYTLPFGI